MTDYVVLGQVVVFFLLKVDLWGMPVLILGADGCCLGILADTDPLIYIDILLSLQHFSRFTRKENKLTNYKYIFN